MLNNSKQSFSLFILTWYHSTKPKPSPHLTLAADTPLPTNLWRHQPFRALALPQLASPGQPSGVGNPSRAIRRHQQPI